MDSRWLNGTSTLVSLNVGPIKTQPNLEVPIYVGPTKLKTNMHGTHRSKPVYMGHTRPTGAHNIQLNLHGTPLSEDGKVNKN